MMAFACWVGFCGWDGGGKGGGGGSWMGRYVGREVGGICSRGLVETEMDLNLG